MTYNFDNIHEFFEGLMNRPNAKVNMLRVYGAYERECEMGKREKEIKDKYDYPGYCYQVHILNDDIAIVEEQYQGKTEGYYAHVGDRKSNCLWTTFEQALLCAVCIKMTGREDASEWMLKLVRE